MTLYLLFKSTNQHLTRVLIAALESQTNSDKQINSWRSCNAVKLLHKSFNRGAKTQEKKDR